VNNGSYWVGLYFSENYYDEANQRIFDVRINGETVLENFDVYSAAGGSFKEKHYFFGVEVTDGLITIATTGHKDVAILNAIVVAPDSS